MKKWHKILGETINSIDTAADYLCKLIIQTLLENNIAKEDDSFKINLVLREGINNAVLHGNRANLYKKVIVKVFNSSEFLKVTIQDQGNGFDWRSKGMIELSESETHGRGLFIIRLYSDKYYYNSKGNKLTFLKKI